jgi:hypothetical protein
MKGEINLTKKNIKDPEILAYKRIFSNTEKTFSERLDDAVELANRIIKIRIETREELRKMLEIYKQTGCLYLKSELYEIIT